MTDIAKVAHDDHQRAKWRAEAARIAIELRKRAPEYAGKEDIKVGVVFNDQVVTLQLPTATITESSEAALAILIFDGVLRMQADLPPPAANDAAPAEPAPPVEVPADGCWRRVGPDFKEQCQNTATGGVGLKLYPHKSIQARYGRKPMLRLVLDLPVCADCFQKMTPVEVIRDGLAAGQWGDLAKHAQRRCNGILPMKEESEIEHVPFTDPEYAQLRAMVAKERAKAPKTEAGSGE